MNTKRCLVVKTLDLALNDLIWGVMENSHECECYEAQCNTLVYDEKEIKNLSAFLKQTTFDLVLSMNFCPSVSAACNKIGIPYASWIYDAPLQSLYHKEAYKDTNYFFFFDKHQLETSKERGLPNINYLPLAANITRMGKLNISPEDEKLYSCDISFVGMQYIDGRYAYYRNHLDEALKIELDTYSMGMIGKWNGQDNIHNRLSEKLIDAMNNLSSEDPMDKLGMPPRVYYEEAVVARAVAYTERRLMMEQVSGLSPRWYGADAKEKDKIIGVDYRPRLYYEDTLPKAYNLSRINLSSCLHSISSGIPLRVFDIMGAGGFIITNYQPEIEELFEIGKEIVVYHNFEELEMLSKFFLAHENERVNLLIAGYEKVCKCYTYPIGVNKILNTVLY